MIEGTHYGSMVIFPRKAGISVLCEWWNFNYYLLHLKSKGSNNWEKYVSLFIVM